MTIEQLRQQARDMRKAAKELQRKMQDVTDLKERGINKEQLLLMLKYGQINVTDNFEITYSDINSYR